MSNRGRPKTTSSKRLAQTKVCKEQSQYQTALGLQFLVWNKIVTNGTNLGAEIRDSGFQWISSLPKTFYESQQDLMEDLKFQGFKQIFESHSLFVFLLSVRKISFKVVIKEIASICEDFLLARKQIASPQEALNEVRRYYWGMQKVDLDVKFKYMRFNVVGILQGYRRIIQKNVLQTWSYYILILTKLIYVVYEKRDIGNLSEIFKSGATSEDAFQQEIPFFEIGNQELRQYLKAQQQVKAQEQAKILFDSANQDMKLGKEAEKTGISLLGSYEVVREEIKKENEDQILQQDDAAQLFAASQRKPRKDRSEMATGTGLFTAEDQRQLQLSQQVSQTCNMRENSEKNNIQDGILEINPREAQGTRQKSGIHNKYSQARDKDNLRALPQLNKAISKKKCF